MSVANRERELFEEHGLQIDSFLLLAGPWFGLPARTSRQQLVARTLHTYVPEIPRSWRTRLSRIRRLAGTEPGRNERPR